MSDLLVCFALFGTLVCAPDLEKNLSFTSFYNPVHYEQVRLDGSEDGFVKPVVRYGIEQPKKK